MVYVSNHDYTLDSLGFECCAWRKFEARTKPKTAFSNLIGCRLSRDKMLFSSNLLHPTGTSNTRSWSYASRGHGSLGKSMVAFSMMHPIPDPKSTEAVDSPYYFQAKARSQRFDLRCEIRPQLHSFLEIAQSQHLSPHDSNLQTHTSSAGCIPLSLQSRFISSMSNRAIEGLLTRGQ